MRKILVAMVAVVGLAGAASSAWATTIRVDSKRSTVTFTSDAPGEKIVGTADGITGTIETDLSNPSATTGTLKVPVERMETGNKLRDRHMRSETWLDAASHPHVEFTITSIEEPVVRAEGDVTRIEGTAVGTVTVHGVAAPARARVVIAVNTATKTVRVQPTFTVELAAHGVRGRDNAIGDTVGREIGITGTVYGSWE